MSWCQTYTGRQFWPLEPSAADVHIEDIAHALSLLCRFNGHCREFYSVAQHSLIVAQQLPSELKLAGLLHDAAEAYIGDMVRPLKRQSSWFRQWEKEVMEAICERFDLHWPFPDEINHADNMILATEARDLMAPPPAPWVKMPEPLDETISPMLPRLAEAEFLREFRRLSGIAQ